jgi:fermentation-respiration switch protein FrsA (DUF1100 family)
MVYVKSTTLKVDMSETYKIGKGSSEVRIDTPATPSTEAVLLLPGITGGAFSDRYQPFVEACTNAGLAVARVSAWKDSHEVGQKTLSEIYTDVDASISLLQRQGYTSIFGVGKSFGGAVILTHASELLKRKVLWAPAIGVSESDANIDRYLSTSLSAHASLFDIKVDRNFLKKVSIPILIIHGTADEAVPIANSEKIVSMLPHAKLVPIEGAGHSYERKDHENAVIKATMDFLTDH